MRASIDTAHYKGPLAKAVTVTTNDPATGPVVLQLKGTVVTPIDVLPSENVAVQGKPGALAPTRVTLSSTEGRRFDILGVAADPALTVAVDSGPHARRRRPKGPVASGASRYDVSIAPRADLPVGRSIATVTFTTNHPGAATVPVHVTLVVAGDVTVAPETVVLTARTGEQPVKISKPEGEALALLGVDSSDPDFAVTSQAVTEGREYRLAVRYAGKPGRGVVRSQITVRTNDPRQGTLVIPVIGYTGTTP